MTHLLIRHQVADFAKWKVSYDKHAPARNAAGLKELNVFRSLDNPSEVILLFIATDLAKAKAFTTSDDVRQAMQHAGVTDKPDIYFMS